MKNGSTKNNVLHKYPARILLEYLSALVIVCSCQHPNKKSIDLAGTWGFKIDSSDVGIQQQWFMQLLDESVILPGSMQENNKGYEPSLTTPWTASIYDSS